MEAKNQNLVTTESVATAAAALAAAGQKVTVRAVIASLGGGSPNAILPLLQKWKSSRPSERNAQIELDPRIAQIVAEQITRAVAEASRDADDRAAQAEDDARIAAEAGQAAEQHAEQLRAQLARAEFNLELLPQLRDEIAQLRAELNNCEAERANARQNAAVLTAQLEAAQQLIARLDKDLAELRSTER